MELTPRVIPCCIVRIFEECTIHSAVITISRLFPSLSQVVPLAPLFWRDLQGVSHFCGLQFIHNKDIDVRIFEIGFGHVFVILLKSFSKDSWIIGLCGGDCKVH